MCLNALNLVNAQRSLQVHHVVLETNRDDLVMLVASV